MISKENTSKSFGLTIGYCMNKPERYEVIFCNGVSQEKKAMIKGFEIQATLNKRVKKPVLHILLSHSPDDTGKIKGREMEIIDEWMSEMKRQKGFDLLSTQFAIIKHKDRDHIHYHIVANMITNSGKRLNIDYIGLKMKDISKEITKRYGLTPAVKREYQNAVMAHGYQIKPGIKRAIYDLQKINRTGKSDDDGIIAIDKLIPNHGKKGFSI